MSDLAEWFRLIVEEKAPRQLKDLASKGLVPFTPERMTIALAVLSGDDDDDIRDQASAKLSAQPRDVVLAVVRDRNLKPLEAVRLAHALPDDEEVAAGLAANPATPLDLLTKFALGENARILETLSRNQDLLRRSPEILNALLMNGALPAELRGYLHEERERQRFAEREMMEEALAEEEIPHEIEFEEVLVKDYEKEDAAVPPQKRPEVVEKRRQSVYQLIRRMNISERIILAFKGNKEARSLLIRDANKMVCTKVLESPRLSDSEVESYAKMTNVSEDVLRGISLKKEWMGKYSIVKALVMNARTPIGVGLPLVNRLTGRDLVNLGRNRNVPEIIRQTGFKLGRQRQEMRGGQNQ